MTLCHQGLILSLLFGIHFRVFGDLLVTGKCCIDLLLIGSFARSYMQAASREDSSLPSVSWDFFILLPFSQQQFQSFFTSVAEFLTGIFCPSMHQGPLEVPCAPLSIYDMQCCTAGLCMWGAPLSLEINAANRNWMVAGDGASRCPSPSSACLI